MKYTAVERFMNYVQMDTQSDPDNADCPSTKKQMQLSQLLVQELLAMGISDAAMDEFGYVYATIPSNTEKNVPTICFCSHVDTAPDASGTDVKPILHQNYTGAPIVLPDDPTQIITVEKYPYLKKHIGSDIITASGKTLLGADDKSGVAIIMDLAYQLVNNPDIKHGKIRILFTPDEEIGRGADKVNIQKLGADFGYTLDGGDCGDFEDETFSADAAVITINGVIAHPGAAKEKLVNALKIAGEILAQLPDYLSPEHTEGREGFIHPTGISGIAEQAKIELIIRDFDTAKLASHEATLRAIAENVMARHPRASFDIAIKEQYRNMKEILQQYPDITKNTEQAYENAGVTPHNSPIRGGTDGSRLSFMGLPCPNIFTGMQAIHSKHEWIGVKDMEKAVDVLIEIVKIWELKAQ